MNSLMSSVVNAVEDGSGLNESQAISVLQWPDNELETLFSLTTRVREEYFGNSVSCCSVMNLKSGRCSEDCSFCAQSAHHGTHCEVYGMKGEDDVLAARSEYPQGVPGHFGLVTSGRGMGDSELDRICAMFRENPATKELPWCASLGILSEAQFRRLYDAGLRRYHHNLETCKSFFDQVCTTHSYEDRITTLDAAVKAGMEVCSGGLFGLGEGLEHRVELALALRELGVHSIPLNFLVPIEGTPVAEHAIPLTREEILKTVAMFRLVCRTPEVRACGGREHYFSDGGRELFAAGATGMMVGGYLTVRGRPTSMDLEMLEELGLEVS